MFFKKKVLTENILTKIYKKYRVRRYISLLFGLLIISIAFNLFLLPNKIVFGGLSGLSIIFKSVLGIEPSLIIMIGSVILLGVSFIFLGKEQTGASILGSLLFPIFVKLTANIGYYIDIDTTQVLLSALFGGVIYGVGAGLIFKAGFTTGGTDIINQIMSKYFHISVGNSMLLCDGLIVLSSVVFFGFNQLMYAIIVLYIISILTDKVILGISDSKAFYIITSKDEEIKDYILTYLNHGVTVFDARGGFTKEKQKVLMCVIPTKEYFKLKEGIHQIDIDAFFVATDAYEVSGGE
ncbi:MAG: YitT family protein [Bacilli bacterium]